MNKAETDYLRSAADELGLRLDERSGTIYGEKNGYGVDIRKDGSSSLFMASFTVKRGNEAPAAADLRRLRKETKQIVRLYVKKNRVQIAARGGMGAKKRLENLRLALDGAAEFFRAGGYENCCQDCGKAGRTDVCCIGGSLMHLCGSCYGRLRESNDVKQQILDETKEYAVPGTIGALLGSLLGAACIVLLGQIGYVASISGMVMALCTLKGYKLFGRKLGTAGIAISSVIIAAMTYIGFRLDWALTIARYYKTDVRTAWEGTTYLLAKGTIKAGNYWGGLALLFLFVLLGAVPTIVRTINVQKLGGVTYMLGSAQGADTAAESVRPE